MPTVISATEAKNRFGEVIRRVYRNGETFIVERDGLPVVVIMPVQRYRMAEQHLMEFSRLVGQAAEREGLAEEQLLQELEEDRRAVYRETYGAGPTA
ncbi:MAG: type II toxin-antitoxin system Phd/YefM family antitoxin [Anaerolineae bacterium]